MTCFNSDKSYAGYGCYVPATYLFTKPKGGSPSSQNLISNAAKTSEIYVTYVTPVTCLKFLVLGLGWGFGSASITDLLPDEYGILCLRAEPCSASECRRSGVERALDIPGVVSPIILVICRSFSKTLRCLRIIVPNETVIFSGLTLKTQRR